jgi:FdhD protein
MVRAAVAPTQVQVVRDDSVRTRPDQLVTEEPMEIRVHGPGQEPEPIAVTMRTPGADFDLAVGYCITEGLLVDRSQLDTVAYCLAGQGEQEYNVVTVRMRTPVDLRGRTRPAAVNASCGVCGKATLDELEQECRPLPPGPTVAAKAILAMAETMRGAQPVFERTGGLHAAARFTPAGELLALREDVGRHNALDKLIGDAARHDALPLHGDVIFVSGRVSFEIVQKAAMAGGPIVAAVSAPSSLAVDTARRLGQTLVGFVRNGACNIYAHPERVEVPAGG